MYPIIFKVHYGEDLHTVQTYEGEYRNLMVLLCDKIFVEDFGECGGMGRCGTCLIKVLHSRDGLTHLDRNEESTLDKLGITDPSYHLSCQTTIDHTLHGAEISVISYTE